MSTYIESTVYIALEVDGADDLPSAAAAVVDVLQGARSDNEWVEGWRFAQAGAAGVDRNDRDPMTLVVPSPETTSRFVLVDVDVVEHRGPYTRRAALVDRLLEALDDAADRIETPEGTSLVRVAAAGIGGPSGEGFGALFGQFDTPTPDVVVEALGPAPDGRVVEVLRELALLGYTTGAGSSARRQMLADAAMGASSVADSPPEILAAERARLGHLLTVDPTLVRDACEQARTGELPGDLAGWAGAARALPTEISAPAYQVVAAMAARAGERDLAASAAWWARMGQAPVEISIPLAPATTHVPPAPAVAVSDFGPGLWAPGCG
ncbi:hypothetical protein [Sanguibacter massiliensis]|uniref:hypothetical protein n=1 Tax=Sanguibacter massiliensis TaxID=1973217 RepID=UPI000C84DB27|nr:hypothetical protein [Sanguibacter massiliensis]